jgi:hypothetical protein
VEAQEGTVLRLRHDWRLSLLIPLAASFLGAAYAVLLYRGAPSTAREQVHWLGPASLFLLWFWHRNCPRRLRVAGGELRIERWLGTTCVPLDRLQYVFGSVGSLSVVHRGGTHSMYARNGVEAAAWLESFFSPDSAVERRWRASWSVAAVWASVAAVLGALSKAWGLGTPARGLVLGLLLGVGIGGLISHWIPARPHLVPGDEPRETDETDKSRGVNSIGAGSIGALLAVLGVVGFHSGWDAVKLAGFWAAAAYFAVLVVLGRWYNRGE